MSKMDLRNSVGVRLTIVVFMTFLLLIPSLMIGGLISDRQQRRDSVANEISRNWGARQVLVGPVLSIPYRHRTQLDEKDPTYTILHAHFLPDHLNVNGTVDPEARNRGIYEVVLYNTNLDLSAEFGSPQFAELNVKSEDIIWEGASVSFGISDMKGVKDPVTVDWNGELLEANPGVPSDDLGFSGMSVPVKTVANQSKYTFTAKLNLNGSFDLLFSPVGKVTSVQLSSKWPNPSFSGDYLPTNRVVDDKGFQADWRVLHISRDFPQRWTAGRYDLGGSLFGVSLLVPVDQYQKTTRTVKYAIMFIALTFLTFFVMEILSSRPIHPMQYLLIGFALLIFYTLLLSLSEYMSFGHAYLLASASIVLMIALYAASFLGNRLRSAIVAVVLAILYGYLYIVLQLQDYALLMGSIILFAALALMMFLTRRIDWFSVLNYRKTGE